MEKAAALVECCPGVSRKILEHNKNYREICP